MHNDLNLKEIQKEWHGTLKSYLIGFLGSILLTVIAFFLVWTRLYTGYGLILTLIGLALIQAVVQLLFFLHVGKESKPRWETLVFLFMVMVLFIIAIGSLWIMYDLKNRVMPSMDTPAKGHAS